MAKRKLPTNPTPNDLRAAIKTSFDRTLIEPDSLRGREQWLNLSAAVHLLANTSDADLRTLVGEADEIGFAAQNLADAKQAAAKLKRWQGLLTKRRTT